MSWLSDVLKDTVKTVAEVAQVAAPIVSPFLAGGAPMLGIGAPVAAAPPISPTLSAAPATLGNPQAISAVPVSGGPGPGGGAGGAGVVPQSAKILGLPKGIVLIGGGIAALGLVFILLKK